MENTQTIMLVKSLDFTQDNFNAIKELLLINLGYKDQDAHDKAKKERLQNTERAMLKNSKLTSIEKRFQEETINNMELNDFQPFYY